MSCFALAEFASLRACARACVRACVPSYSSAFFIMGLLGMFFLCILCFLLRPYRFVFCGCFWIPFFFCVCRFHRAHDWRSSHKLVYYFCVFLSLPRETS